MTIFHILTHRISAVLALLMVCALCYAPLRAQTLDSTKADSVEKPRENWSWVHFGAGLSYCAIGQGPVVGGELGLSVAWKSNIASIQINSATTLLSDYVTSIGGMYGLIERNDSSFTSISAGISYTYHGRAIPGTSVGFLGPSQYENIGTVGLIAEAQAGIKGNISGLILKIFGNLNFVRPFISLMLIIPLGWMP